MFIRIKSAIFNVSKNTSECHSIFWANGIISTQNIVFSLEGEGKKEIKWLKCEEKEANGYGLDYMYRSFLVIRRTRL